AFVATKEPSRARAFYEGCLGLRLVKDDTWALVFDANGTVLRIQKVEELPIARHTILGWLVPNITTAVRELQKKGVSFEHYPFLRQDESGIWTTPEGARVAWFKDPDGNVLSITQLAATPGISARAV